MMDRMTRSVRSVAVATRQLDACAVAYTVGDTVLLWYAMRCGAMLCGCGMAVGCDAMRWQTNKQRNDPTVLFNFLFLLELSTSVHCCFSLPSFFKFWT